MENIRADLVEYLDREVDRLHIPGVVVGIIYGDEELIISRGVTNVDHPLDVDETTLFQIGSRSKTFTGMALMRQVEAGLIDLDAPLLEYLPNFTLGNAEFAKSVTTRHLLTHTGGWLGDYLLVSPVRGRGEDTLARVVETIAEAPCMTPPGEVFSYNNAGFSLAGRLLEILTGETFEESVKKLIFEPLGMDHSFFFADEAITERTSSGHIVRNGVPKVARPWAISRCSNPGGGIISDVVDQLKYARFHLGDGTGPDGERIMSAETLADMQAEHATAGGMCDGVGLPWLLSDVGDVRAVSHSGGTNGLISAFTLVPEKQFAITVFTNADTGRVLSRGVEKWALERVLGAKETPPTQIERSPEELDEYAGVYAFGVVKLEREGPYLVVKMQPVAGSELMDEESSPVRIAFYDRDLVVGLDEPSEGEKGDFLLGDDGQIMFFRWGGRILPRYAAGD